MRRELLELASELARRGEPFAIATVVARRPPMSAQAGDVALVTRTGGFHGWVGGSCTRPTVIAEALAALADSRPRLVALDPDPERYRRPGLTVFPMTCHSGGSVEIHIQPVLPAPQLVVYGASPVARALVRLGAAMSYRVHAVDPAADADTFPGADAIATDPGQLQIDRAAAPLFAVVATQGDWDEPALLAALAQRPDYVSLVASPRRFSELRALLAAQIPVEALARIKNPAGLDLGARTPEEIALAILAEIVQERRRQDVKDVPHASAERHLGEPAARPGETTAGKPTLGDAMAGAAPAGAALDPVCGMTVRDRARAPRAAHGGREYFFCCPGCQVRFQAAPERYLGAP
jgi:xanthine dehydrogenase accessory factor